LVTSWAHSPFLCFLQEQFTGLAAVDAPSSALQTTVTTVLNKEQSIDRRR